MAMQQKICRSDKDIDPGSPLTLDTCLSIIEVVVHSWKIRGNTTCFMKDLACLKG